MNMQNIMAQAQKMQRDIAKKQEEIYKTSFTGNSEWVKVTMLGDKTIVKIEITYTGDLNVDKDILADMITVAMNDALKQINKEIDKQLGSYSSMLGGLM